MNPRQIIVDVAERYIGTREVTPNRFPGIEEFWKATTYPDGAEHREPYCCAFVSFVVQKADGLSVDINLPHPPRCPSVAGFEQWARDPKNGCLLFHPGDPLHVPLAGDIVSFRPHFSHIGIVRYAEGDVVGTVEANTNEAGSRDGDGIMLKVRKARVCGTFIRLPAAARV